MVIRKRQYDASFKARVALEVIRQTSVAESLAKKKH